MKNEIPQRVRIVSAIDNEGDTWHSLEDRIKQEAVVIHTDTLFIRVYFPEDGASMTVPVECAEPL